jgi:hypothetical protein
MAEFTMFIEHRDIGGEQHKSGPVPLKAKTKKDASTEAMAEASSLFPSIASNVFIRVVGGSNGKPIAEISAAQIDRATER